MSIDCTAIVDMGAKALCEYAVSLAPAATPECATNQYVYDPYGNGTLECGTYLSLDQKVAGALGDQGLIDAGNTAWMLASAALVMIMTPAVGIFYAGLAGEENASNTVLMSFASMCIVSVQWYLVGYSFSFGPGTPGFGSFDWAALTGVSYAPSAAYGWSIPHILWVAFQCMFAMITPALISGALVGRMKFSAWCVFVFLWTTFIYDPLAHWVWSLTLDPADYSTVKCLGFLCSLGAIDFAGGAVIHISSGFSALAAVIVLGRRYNAGEPMKPHNAPLVVLGASLLWFGWFGFNAGSAGGALSAAPPASVASLAFINTHTAAAAATLSWMFVEKMVSGAPTASGAAVGAVAGLVAITPACGFVSMWSAIIFGLVTPPVCIGGIHLKGKLGLDDTLDTFAVHGLGGVVGAFLTGLFADPGLNFGVGAFYGDGGKLLGMQLAAICVSATFSFVGTLVIMLVLKYTMGVRVSEDAEKMGIDLSEHGAKAYMGPAATAESKAMSAS